MIRSIQQKNRAGEMHENNKKRYLNELKPILKKEKIYKTNVS